MMTQLDNMLNFHAQALKVRDQRQQVLASNIANADTPNYKARDLDFKATLQSALKGAAASGGVAMAATAPGHMKGNPGTGGRTRACNTATPPRAISTATRWIWMPSAPPSLKTPFITNST